MHQSPSRSRVDPATDVEDSPQNSTDAGASGRNEVFEILSNERRRFVLEYLESEPTGEADLQTLVTAVAVRENETTPENLTAGERKSVYVGLRQTHLPKMDEVGVVEFDKERGTVSLTTAARRAKQYLDVPRGPSVPASHALGSSGVCGLLVALAWFGVLPSGVANGLGIAAAIVVLFLIVTVAHVIGHRKRIRASN